MDVRGTAALIIIGVAAVCAVWYFGRALLMRQGLQGEDTGTDRANQRAATAHIDMAIAATTDDLRTRPRPGSPTDQSDDDVESAGVSAQLPESLASAIVSEWARGRTCVSCGGPVTEMKFSGHHIALLEPSGITREWVDVAADRLPLALATSLPLCWNCHLAASFRRMHPELVTDREEGRMHSRGLPKED